ncbi:MAG: MBL fold metallo-hydrolase [Bacteroidota bacterium]|nr:MBL fold metallo-hydrolase [Bacteroidota bacterium]MDP3146124.1 MBL fold metallo-hydrolase [Bacteroidota bacterium]
MKQKIKVHFLGASATVTGSKYFIETENKNFLVDCGLFQGLKELRLLNWDELPINVSEIDFILLTHGHLDHVGYLPRLVSSGFKGKIYGTAPTLDIAKIILLDSAKIQEEEAERANKGGYSKHDPAKALYTVRDVKKTLNYFMEIEIDKWFNFGDDMKVRYQTNGHIIGSAFIEVDIAKKRFVFSGDVGQEKDFLMYPPKRPQKADILFVESTYGDRLHPKQDIKEQLKKVILETIAKGGSIIIPSFAVERTQTLMYLIWQLRKAKEIPEIPLIMDSPMGANVLEVFHKHLSWHKLPIEECNAMCKIFNVVRDYKDTLEIIATTYPKIVIAGSGMVTGGRILNYLQEYIGKPETTLLFVGYQGVGTRGRKLFEGAHETKIYGKYYQVKANIESIEGLSAHGDQKDLLNWMSEIENKPEKVFIIHGEKQASDTFRVKIKDTYGWDCTIPKLFETIEIES